MKPSRLALWSAAGMLLASTLAYSFTPHGEAIAAPVAEPESTEQAAAATPPAQEEDLAHFTDGATLTVEGQIGHPKLAQDGPTETFVMLEVKASAGQKAKRAAPVNLALVIDRSGSMKGTRIRNAIKAAVAAVERLGEGDVVSVITFDTGVQTVVAPTIVSDATRQGIVRSIQRIVLGGDTCISCGVEGGMAALAQTTGKVTRMILLSDGDANHGVRDMPGFRSLAVRARDHGVAITTIGVDVEYNEKVLSAISEESNGRHHFVENDTALARVFEQEAESLTSTVAADAEVAVDLAPGVELVRVFDRSFRRLDGGRIAVPLGSFGGTDTKTVLLKVRVPVGTAGKKPVAEVAMNYRDLVGGGSGRCGGKLGVQVVASAAEASDLDPVVAGRLARSETVATLKEANHLFEQGKLDEAKRRLDVQTKQLQDVVARSRNAKHASPKRAAAVDEDVARQLDAVGGASSGFSRAPSATSPSFSTPGAQAAPAPPPQATRAGQSALKSNQVRARDL